MPKGYSKEIMEELFKQEQVKQEEQKRQEQEAARVRAARQLQIDYDNKLDVLLAELRQSEEQIEDLSRQVKRLRIIAIVALVLAIIVAGVGLNDMLQEIMYMMP